MRCFVDKRFGINFVPFLASCSMKAMKLITAKLICSVITRMSVDRNSAKVRDFFNTKRHELSNAVYVVFVLLACIFSFWFFSIFLIDDEITMMKFPASNVSRACVPMVYSIRFHVDVKA